MTTGVLARASLRFYFRSHAGTVAGVVIAAAVLTGALLVGDSVRGSLREMALARLGKVDVALASGDRLFRADLAERMAAKLPDADIIAALQVPGTASRPDGSARANQVQIIGVGDHFFGLAQSSPAAALSENGVWINERLANQLQAREGETVVLRVPRASAMSRDAPMTPAEDATTALRLKVEKILSDAEFGRFGLAASQVPPFNAFVPLGVLQQQIQAANQANLLLGRSRSSSVAQFQDALQRAFTLADAQIGLREMTNSAGLELRSSRVFLDDQIATAAKRASSTAQPVLTYFVNELRVDGHSTPYSMVSGISTLTPAGMKDDEILINQWLADDLNAKAGDELSMRYFVMGVGRELQQRTNRFHIREIVPMQFPYLDPTLMPDFPGMADAENCRDWNTGLPINTDAIRPKDEDYWHKYRGAPKAFVTLHAAQSMWTNRFGTLTAVRYPNGMKAAASSSEIAGRILNEIHPRDLGFIFQPVREQALAASSGAQDFGGLFIGFSFFLIAAALILISLLFRFALEQRGGEVGILLALGFPARKVRRLLVLEGLGLAILGGIIGTGLAVLYARVMLYGLSTIWSGAVAGANLSYHGEAQTLAIGFASSVIISVLTIWWSLRREGKRSARELLSEGFAEDMGFTAGKRKSRRGAGLLWICGVCAAGLGIAIAVWGLMQREQQTADTFFSAGALVLIGGLILASALIRQLGRSSAAAHLSLTGMGVRGITRRRQRSRAAIGLLACGAFLIASIGVFHLDSGAGDRARSSGTGGFALVGDASIPIVQDLNSKPGREFFNLTAPEMQDVRFAPFRVSDGEDASCLNLNRALRPRILGVNPELLNERHAFTFNKTLGAARDANPWLLLNQDFGPGVVPAIGDAASIQWALGKSVGDELEMTDANGQTFRLKIVGAVANSILQGSLIISEQQFIRRFPNDAGYRMFLIDAPIAHAPEIARTLTKAMQDAGFEAESASARLAAFNAVQNTYLGTFQMLGGLGLLLGTFGLGIILLRNVFERRSELALLLAVGFQKSSLRRLVLSEHAMLLFVGLFIGIAAAVIAVLPSLLTPGARLPLGQLGWTLGAVFLCGLVCTIVAASAALRAPLLKSLRNE